MSTFMSQRHLKLNIFPRNLWIVPLNVGQISMFPLSVNEISRLPFLPVRNLEFMFGMSSMSHPIFNVSANPADVTLQRDPKSFHFFPFLPPLLLCNPWICESWTVVLASYPICSQPHPIQKNRRIYLKCKSNYIILSSKYFSFAPHCSQG